MGVLGFCFIIALGVALLSTLEATENKSRHSAIRRRDNSEAHNNHDTEAIHQIANKSNCTKIYNQDKPALRMLPIHKCEMFDWLINMFYSANEFLNHTCS